MLGKLIKHDLISGARKVGMVYLVDAVAVIAMIIISYLNAGTLVQYLCLAAVVLISLVAVILTFTSVIFGANKSLFGRQGYLSQTLPVKTESLLFSKWLTGSIWVSLSYALVLLSIFLVGSYMSSSGTDVYGIVDMIRTFLSSMDLANTGFYVKLAYECINGLLVTCMFVLFIFFAMTIGAVRPFDKLGILGILLYFVITVAVVQGLGEAVEEICDISLIIGYDGGYSLFINPDLQTLMEQFPNGYYTCAMTLTYVKILMSVVLFIIMVQLTDKKINLK